MNKLLLSLLGIALSGLSATAQTMPPDTARTHRHTFGLTASPQLAHFFTANRSLPIGLLYKRQLTPTKALRLRLVGYYSRRDTSNYWSRVPTSTIVGYIEGPNTTSWELSAYAGYEWQQPLGKRFYYTYGLELGAGWNQLRSEHLLQFSEPTQAQLGTETGTNTISTWTGRVRPFAGVHFRMTKTLDLFAESALLVAYSHRQQDIITHTIYFNGTGDGGRSITSSALTLFWFPVQLIGGTFLF